MKTITATTKIPTDGTLPPEAFYDLPQFANSTDRKERLKKSARRVKGKKPKDGV